MQYMPNPAFTEMKDYIYTPMEVLPQLRKSGGDIIASYKSINVPKTFPKEAELCSTGAENKRLIVTFVSEHFRHGLEAFSCSPWHGFGDLLIQCTVPTDGVIFPVVVPDSPFLDLRPSILGHSKFRELKAPGLQINLPICSKMAHVRAHPFNKAVITTLTCLPTVFRKKTDYHLPTAFDRIFFRNINVLNCT